MLLESNILFKKYIAIAIDDKTSMNTNMKDAFFSYEHFQGIESIDLIDVCFSQEALKLSIINSINNNKNLTDIQKRKIDYSREYFIHKPSYSYKKSIFNAINKYVKQN